MGFVELLLIAVGLSMAAIFEAMAEFYYALYIIDIKNDTFVPVRGTEATLKVLGGCTSYRQAAKEFIETFVFPDDMDTARRFTSPRYLASVLSPASPYCRIEVREGREPRYEWVAVVFKAVEFDGGEASKAVLAVENVDGMRASLQLDEQTRMQSFARKLNADVERRLRSLSRKTNDERAAMIRRVEMAGGRISGTSRMETDLQKKDYNSNEISDYIYGSAEVVGLMCLKVFYSDDADGYESLKYPARKLGEAFQKVNFLRDIRADYQQLGRTYFPGVDFTNFTEEAKERIEKDIQHDFNEAYKGIVALKSGARLGVYLAYRYYLQLFKKIKRANAREVAKQRYRISNLTKATLLAKSYLRDQIGIV